MLNKINTTELNENTFKLIGSDWMLITAGPKENYNTMTANWGGFGVLWFKNICWIVVRPCRYTYVFLEKSNYFTLTFFDEQYKSALNLCGTKSGRNINKAKEAGITPIDGFTPRTTTFAEARLVITCKKLYLQDINPANFIDASLDENYPEKDYHRMYVGEIVSIVKED